MADKSWYDVFTSLPAQFALYPDWAKVFFGITLVAVALSLCIWFFMRPPETTAEPPPAKVEAKPVPPLAAASGPAPKMEKSMRADDAGKPTKVQQNQTSSGDGATNIQAGRDVYLQAPAASVASKAQEKIRGLVLEARLTATLKDGAEIPPGQVDYWPVSDAAAYLEGPGGRARLVFVSPVIFRRIDGNRLVVINRFSLDPSSEFVGRQLEVLQNFTGLKTPITTIVWGKSLDRISQLEVTLSINGADPTYHSWPYDVVFGEGPVFDVPAASIIPRK